MAAESLEMRGKQSHEERSDKSCTGTLGQVPDEQPLPQSSPTLQIKNRSNPASMTDARVNQPSIHINLHAPSPESLPGIAEGAR